MLQDPSVTVFIHLTLLCNKLYPIPNQFPAPQDTPQNHLAQDLNPYMCLVLVSSSETLLSLCQVCVLPHCSDSHKLLMDSFHWYSFWELITYTVIITVGICYI